MTAVAFDTYALVRKPKDSGFSEDQAEAITGALRHGRDADLAQLATKADVQASEIALRTELRGTETALKSDLREVESTLRTDLRKVESVLRTDLRETEVRLDAKIADLSHRLDLGLAGGRADLKLLEQRMTVKLGALVAAAVGILIAAIRYLPPAGH